MSGAMWKKRCGHPQRWASEQFVQKISEQFFNTSPLQRSCDAHGTTRKRQVWRKNNICSCALHSMHIIICGDAMSHPLSIIVVWSNNYHMIWIDVTNLHPLIACYIQAILVLTLKTKTQSSHPPDLLCLADDTRCMLCAQAFVLKPKIIEMLPGLIMKLHNIMLNLPHEISCSY